MPSLPRNWLRCLPAAWLLPAVLQCSDPLHTDGSMGVPTFDYRQLPQQVASLPLGFTSTNSFGDRSGNTMAVAQREALYLVDVGDPHRLRVDRTIPWERFIHGVALSEQSLHFIDSSGLHILDRASSADVPVGELLVDDQEFPEVLLVEQQCFMGIRNSQSGYSLLIIDVSDRTNPVVLSTVPFDRQILDLVRQGDLLAVGTNQSTVFLDVGNPLQVETLSRVDAGSYVALGDGFAFVTGQSRFYSRSGIKVFDIHDPINPVQVGSTTVPTGAGPMCLQEDRLYTRINDRVEVLDVHDPQLPATFATLSAPGSGWMSVDGEYVWSVGSGLVVHELSETTHPPILGEQMVSVSIAIGVDLHKLVARGSMGVFTLDVRNPMLPSPPTFFPGLSSQGTVDAGRLYTRRNQQEIEIRDLHANRVLDVLDLSPLVLREHDNIAWMGAQGDRLVVVMNDEIDSRYEVLVFDVGGREQNLRGRLYVEGDPRAYVSAALMDEQTLYVALDTGSPQDLLDVVDLSKPHRPELLSRTTTENSGNALHLRNGYLYLDTLAEFLALDVRDRRSPRIASTQQSAGGVLDIVSQGNVLYVMTGSEMVVMDLTRPGEPAKIASRAHASDNVGRALFATEHCLLALRNQSVEALPLHAGRK